MTFPKWKSLHATALLVAFLSMISFAFPLRRENSLASLSTGTMDKDSGFLLAEAPEDTPEDAPSGVSWLQASGGEEEDPYMQPYDSVPRGPEEEHIYEEVPESPYTLAGRPRRRRSSLARRRLPSAPPGRTGFTPEIQRRASRQLRGRRPQSWAAPGSVGEGGGPGASGGPAAAGGGDEHIYESVREGGGPGPSGGPAAEAGGEEHLYEEVGRARRSSGGPEGDESPYWMLGQPAKGEGPSPSKEEGPVPQEETPLHPEQYIGPMWSVGPPLRPVPPVPTRKGEQAEKAGGAEGGAEGEEGGAAGGAAAGGAAPFVRGGPGRTPIREKKGVKGLFEKFKRGKGQKKEKKAASASPPASRKDRAGRRSFTE